jgi:Luciferase-like monooxygenase
MTVEAPSPPLNGSLDYGQPLEFGYFLVPNAGDPHGVLATARRLERIERLGYDLVGVQDHLHQPRNLDTLSLLAAILGQTETVRVFADVGDLPLRPPAVLAKAAATLDLLSDGRFELGIGAGGDLEAAQAMGAPAKTPAESLEALEEALALMRAIGFSTFVLATPPDPHTLATLTEEVPPQVRERVAERRASSPVPAISPEHGA